MTRASVRHTQQSVEQLMAILSIMRPDGSYSEEKMIKEHIMPLGGITIDKAGNLYKKIGDLPVLWSSHTDTVHRFGGVSPLEVNDHGIITIRKVAPKSQASCLGADDGAGVWLMIQMIKAERPGLYVFHRGEEVGCKGSRWAAKNLSKMLETYKFAIAFDRKGTDSIITHQCGTRCCSEEFSKSMGDLLKLGYKSDSTGMYTDTAQYTDLIGECTNLSVGYYGQHGESEELDLKHIVALHDALMDLDASKLVVKRKPGEKEPSRWSYNRHENTDDDELSWMYGGQGGFGGEYHNHGGGTHKRHDKSAKGKKTDPLYARRVVGNELQEWDPVTHGWEPMGTTYNYRVLSDWPRSGINSSKDDDRKGQKDSIFKVHRKLMDGTTNPEPETYINLIKDFPEEIAAFLEDKKYGLAYLHAQIRIHGGKVESTLINKKGGTS